MRKTVEYERKLEAPSGFELPDLGGVPLEPRVFNSVYHDTASRSLARVGITLRRRIERGTSLWQLKLPAADARLELEEPGGPVGPPERLRTLIRTHERHGPVAPVADLRTRRNGALVSVNGTKAEVTVDSVAVMDAHRVESEFVELEIEVVDGGPDGVEQIVKELERAGAFVGSETPKLFRVLELEPRRPASDAPFESLRALLQHQLDQILAHDPGTRLGVDPESLHDMRVAVRRSRALLRAGRMLVATDASVLSEELTWLGTVLGAVRDLDVLLDHLRGEAATLGETDRPAASRLLRTLDRRRGRARRVLLRALDGERYGALLDGFEETLSTFEPSDDPSTLAALAKRQLRALRRDVRALGEAPENEALHGLRKRGKRTRYAYELAGADAVVKRAKAFQDVLGEHQDSVIAEEQLRELAVNAPFDQVIAAGRLIEREQARQAEARAAWRDAWRRLQRAAR